MKILYVSTISNTINAFMIPHIEMLVSKGHTVDIVCNIKKEIDPKLIALGCRVFNIKFQRSPLKRQNYTAYKKLKNLIKKEGYDLVHTHTPVASAITRLACRNIKNIKVLYTAHGFHFFKGAPLTNWLLYYPIEKVLGRFTDGIITMNEEDYLLANKIKLRKDNSIYKVHGVGVNLSKFKSQTKDNKLNVRKEYGYKEEDFILFYAAELNHNKQQDFLINVVAILKYKIPKIRLLLAGSGPLQKKYKDLAKELGVEGNIEFLGSRSDIPNLLTLSDMVVASSRREGLPVNIMEAMAVGLPIVATDVRGHRDLVKDEKNGYIIESEDIESFSNAIEKLYKDNELKLIFGEKGIDLVQKYSIENVLEEMEEIYDKN